MKENSTTICFSRTALDKWQESSRPRENRTLSLWLGENEAFRKRFSNQRNLKTQAFRFHVGEKRFENRPFRKRFSNGGIRKRRFFVFMWTENIFQTKLFENDDVTTIT